MVPEALVNDIAAKVEVSLTPRVERSVAAPWTVRVDEPLNAPLSPIAVPVAVIKVIPDLKSAAP